MTTPLPERLLELVGGPENVQDLTHCFVRLRFKLHNNDEAQQDAITALPDVVMVLNQSGQLQIALTSHLLTTYTDITELLQKQPDQHPQKEQQTMIERTATIGSRVGLHARPAAAFVEAASEYENLNITIAHKGEPAEEAIEATSMLGVMSLAAAHGDTVVLRAVGKNAEKALDNLVQFLAIDHDAV